MDRRFHPGPLASLPAPVVRRDACERAVSDVSISLQ